MDYFLYSSSTGYEFPSVLSISMGNIPVTMRGSEDTNFQASSEIKKPVRKKRVYKKK